MQILPIDLHSSRNVPKWEKNAKHSNEDGKELFPPMEFVKYIDYGCSNDLSRMPCTTIFRKWVRGACKDCDCGFGSVSVLLTSYTYKYMTTYANISTTCGKCLQKQNNSISSPELKSQNVKKHVHFQFSVINEIAM